MKEIKINNEKFKKWRKKNWRELDIFVFGIAYEDEKGNRINPMDVVFKYENENRIYTITK